MKKALVFRTAQTHVVSELIEKLECKNYKIWCVVQESSLDDLKTKYPSVNYITAPDGFFDYKKFKADRWLVKKIRRAKCGRVFVPSSSYEFNNFLEIRRIIYSLGFKKITYFVAYGKAVTMDLTLSELCAERLVKSSLFIDFLILLSNTVSFVSFIKNKILKISR